MFAMQKIRHLISEYPRTFWTLVIVTFIDRLGGSLLFPFFALYITQKFGVNMTTVGVLFAAFSLSSFVGSGLGGALADRMGRRGMIIFSLISTSVSSVLMGLVNSLQAFFTLAFVVGIFTDAGGPAYNAIVADLLPEEKRQSGYGILRVTFNLAVVFGPIIGGFLAGYSYLLLFLVDAAFSLLVAGIVYLVLPETKPEPHPDAKHESILGTFIGYGRVLRDRVFMLFCGIFILGAFVYMNMNTTLGVYLRDVHGIQEAGYGGILSLNAAMVVLMQFGITHWTEKHAPMRMLALGALLYAVGFGMYGFDPIHRSFSFAVGRWSLNLTGAYFWFLLAMAVITVGEMIIAPVSQAVSSNLAPEDMRGRYNAIFGYAWGIPFAVGPYLAGLVMDNYDPRWLWYIAGVLGIMAAWGFLSINHLVPRKLPGAT